MPKKDENSFDDEPIGSDDSEESSEESSVDIEETKKQSRRMSALDHNDLFADFDPDEEDDIEDELRNEVTRLDEPPTVGGMRGRNSSSMFGNRANVLSGRATSPKLMAQAANMPSCTQLRVWKWENGVPVGLGAIDSQASEEDLVREFYDAMPQKGEGRCQFRLRPIDISGNELGTEIHCMISEHHAALQKMRRIKDAGENTKTVSVNNYHQDTSSRFSNQFERMMQSAEKRAEILERQLENEREEMRRRENQRAQEQVDLATNAAQGVQVLTERMMADESKRAERAMAMQSEQSQTLITTLTSIFAQQQTMLQAQLEQQRRQDEYRLEQERQRAARDREDERNRRDRERLELEERRLREREEYERKMQHERESLERRLIKEQKEIEVRMQREREEMQLRIMREKEEREARDRWFAEERLRRESQEREDSRTREQDRQRQHERMMRELEIQQQKDREHAERMMLLSKQELQTKAMGGLGEMLPLATGMLKKMGLEPMDVVQKVFAPEKEESSWTDALPKLLGAGADIARVALAGKAPPVSPIQGMPQMLPQNGFNQMNPLDYAQQMERLKQVQGFDEQFEDDFEDDFVLGEEPQKESGVISFRDTDLGKESKPTSQPTSQPNQDSSINKAANAGMTLSEQRDARNALSELVGQLHQSDQSDWEALITQAIMSEPQIFNYIQAVSVRNAIRETGADNTFTENIVNALKKSALVPKDVNYGV